METRSSQSRQEPDSCFCDKAWCHLAFNGTWSKNVVTVLWRNSTHPALALQEGNSLTGVASLRYFYAIISYWFLWKYSKVAQCWSESPTERWGLKPFPVKSTPTGLTEDEDGLTPHMLLKNLHLPSFTSGYCITFCSNGNYKLVLSAQVDLETFPQPCLNRRWQSQQQGLAGGFTLYFHLASVLLLFCSRTSNFSTSFCFPAASLLGTLKTFFAAWGKSQHVLLMKRECWHALSNLLLHSFCTQISEPFKYCCFRECRRLSSLLLDIPTQKGTVKSSSSPCLLLTKCKHTTRRFRSIYKRLVATSLETLAPNRVISKIHLELKAIKTKLVLSGQAGRTSFRLLFYPQTTILSSTTHSRSNSHANKML